VRAGWGLVGGVARDVGHSLGVEWTGDDAAEARVFPSMRLRNVFVEVEEEEVTDGLSWNELEEVAGGFSFCRSKLSNEWADGRNALLSEGLDIVSLVELGGLLYSSGGFVLCKL
jgi:hypothetical protein